MPRATRTYDIDQLLESFQQHTRIGKIKDKSSLQRELNDWFANPALVSAIIDDVFQKPQIIKEVEDNREEEGIEPFTQTVVRPPTPSSTKRVKLTVTPDIIRVKNKMYTRWRDVKTGRFAKAPPPR